MFIRTVTGDLLNLAQMAVIRLSSENDSPQSVIDAWEVGHGGVRFEIFKGDLDACRAVMERLEEKLNIYVISVGGQWLPRPEEVGR